MLQWAVFNIISARTRNSPTLKSNVYSRSPFVGGLGIGTINYLDGSGLFFLNNLMTMRYEYKKLVLY